MDAELQSFSNTRRGFTLVELMVALTGGLIFTLFVFMMTRDVSRFFQRQTGLSDATLSVVTGYQRLRADVQRAGFLATPNVAKDPRRCPAAGTGIPASWDANFPQLSRLALARVEPGASLTTLGSGHLLSEAGLTTPDKLYLYGNYTSVDQYPVKEYLGGTTIELEPNSVALERAGYATNAQSTLDQLFPTGRILRAVSTNTGEEQYSIITGVDASDTNRPRITIASPTVPFVFKTNNPLCGLRGHNKDMIVNTVNIIRYSVADMTNDSNYDPLLFSEDPGFNSERTELVREEIDPSTADGDLDASNTSMIFPGTRELVAEFAVDFKVSVVAVTSVATGATSFLDENDSDFLAYAGDPTEPAALVNGMGPHLIRALHPRLSVRTRAPDRQADVPDAPPGVFRMPLTVTSPSSGGGSSTASDYTRVRTLQSHIMTRNAGNHLNWN